uniref:Uncharacterized protein n=1 Tax=Aegilops tauschii subsp. strangulata TaxID=200361 RepID=A0A453QBE4_AEGTS
MSKYIYFSLDHTGGQASQSIMKNPCSLIFVYATLYHVQKKD